MMYTHGKVPPLNSIQKLMNLVFISCAVLSTGLDLLVRIFSRGISCIGGCSEAAKIESMYLLGACVLFVLSIIVSIGILERKYWARILAIMFCGILIFPLVMTSKYWLVKGLHDFPIIIGGRLFIPAAAIFYYTTPNLSGKWENKNIKSILIAIGFFVIGAYFAQREQHIKSKIDQPRLLELQKKEEQKIQGVIKAGQPYKNLQYRFELTFNSDKTIFKEREDNNSTQFAFSTKMDIPPGEIVFGGYTDTFTVNIGNVYDNQDTPAGIANNALKYEPRCKVYSVTFNGIWFVKIDHFADGESFSFLTAHNNKLFEFSNGGGMKLAPFEQIMQTIKFMP